MGLCRPDLGLLPDQSRRASCTHAQTSFLQLPMRNILVPSKTAVPTFFFRIFLDIRLYSNTVLNSLHVLQKSRKKGFEAVFKQEMVKPSVLLLTYLLKNSLIRVSWY